MDAFVACFIVLFLTSNAAATTLDYSNKGYTEIPHNETVAPSVTEFILKNNKLTAINHAEFSLYVLLEELDLSNNDISYISDAAFSGTKISRLNLTNNQLQVLPRFTGIEEILTKLRVDHNNIYDISTMQHLTALTHFYAYGNKFSSIANIFQNNLIVLQIGGNSALRTADAMSLETLTIIKQNPTLRNLLLISMNLANFPDLSELTNTLTYLTLSWNWMVNIPAENLNVLGKLIWLNLRGNSITVLPSFWGVASSLQYLYLGWNKLNGTTLEPLSELVKLRHLELRNNPMTHWPNFTLIASQTLYERTLDLDHITTLPTTYTATYCHFHTVFMRKCGLTEYPDLEACCGNANTKLTTLRLEENRLTSNASIDRISHVTLQNLYLGSNAFTQLPTIQKELFPNLVNLNMNGNDLSTEALIMTDPLSIWLENTHITSFPYGILPVSSKLMLSDNSMSKLDPWKMNMALCQNSGLVRLDLSRNSFANISTIPNLKAALCHYGRNTHLILKGIPMTCECKMLWMRETMLCGDTITANALPCNETSQPCTDHAKIKRITNGSGVSRMTQDCESKVRLSFITDYDITSCYDITKDAETIELDLSEQIALAGTHTGISEVTVTTYDMDCRFEFHVLVYQPPKLHRCGSRARCTLKSREEPHRCTFRCDCPANDCGDESVVFVRVAHPLTGYLCEITTRAGGVKWKL